MTQNNFALGLSIIYFIGLSSFDSDDACSWLFMVHRGRVWGLRAPLVLYLPSVLGGIFALVLMLLHCRHNAHVDGACVEPDCKVLCSVGFAVYAGCTF